MPVDEHFHTDRLVVIGPGLLGTSVALGLKQRGFAGQAVALGRSKATLDLAATTGAYDELTDDPAKALAGATLAIIAVPLSGFRAVFAQLAEHGEPGLVITDVGSTKASVIEDAKASFGDLSRIIGAHPMAGSEKAGPSACDPDLFEGKPCILTLGGEEAQDAIDLVTRMWQMLGMSLLTMTPEEHDRQAAVVSHLPHLAAVMLVQIAETMGGLDLASTGYRDTTRLASSNPPMRADILLANRGAVVEALAALTDQADSLRQSLEQGDRDAVLALLEDSKKARERWLADGRTSR